MAVFNVTVAVSIFVWTEVTVGVSTIITCVCVGLFCVVDTVVSAGEEEELEVVDSVKVGAGEDTVAEVGLGSLG